MRVAYLVNQYPHPSHSFIRREILALESQGVEVRRYSVRRSALALVDPADRAEQGRTHILLERKLAVLGHAAVTTLSRPLRMLRALRYSLRVGRHSRGRHLAYLIEAAALVRELARAGVQHLHVHFGTNPATVALLARQLGGPPFSITVHGPEEFDRPLALALGDKIRAARFVAAVSSFGRSQLQRWSAVADWPRIQVVRCGLDHAYLAAPAVAIPADSRQLICVGRLCEQKGQLVLVDAVAALVREGITVQLVLIGDGPLRGLIEERIADHGLEGSVQLRGWQDQDQIQAALQASRAFVLPSFAEGLPVAIMEALALRRPVVSTFIAGIPELIEDGVHGFLVPAGSVEHLTEALRRVLVLDTTALDAMGESGARRVAEAHDVTREAAHLAELMQDGTPT